MTNCFNCGKETKNYKFCSRSCSAKINNRRKHSEESKRKTSEKLSGRTKLNKDYKFCSFCGERVLSKTKKYCVRNKCIKFRCDKELLGEKTGLSITTIKRYLRRNNILDFSHCSICNIENTWNGAKLVMQVDHINGNPNDNMIENLRSICPNCHSQTTTFTSKNIGKNVAP